VVFLRIEFLSGISQPEVVYIKKRFLSPPSLISPSKSTVSLFPCLVVALELGETALEIESQWLLEGEGGQRHTWFLPRIIFLSFGHEIGVNTS